MRRIGLNEPGKRSEEIAQSEPAQSQTEVHIVIVQWQVHGIESSHPFEHLAAHRKAAPADGRHLPNQIRRSANRWSASRRTAENMTGESIHAQNNTGVLNGPVGI